MNFVQMISRLILKQKIQFFNCIMNIEKRKEKKKMIKKVIGCVVFVVLFVVINMGLDYIFNPFV